MSTWQQASWSHESPAASESAPRRRVLLGFPGPSMLTGACLGLMTCTKQKHDVRVEFCGRGWDDMNLLWVSALNALERGERTHFALLHSDIMPDQGWLDVLLEELERTGADFISAVAPLKDRRGLTSCGIGNPDNPWVALRRFSMHELYSMPETFDVDDTPHPDKYLLHNTGCLCVDMRNEKWRTVDEFGRLVAYFGFPWQTRRDESGAWVHERESEDWYFSRTAHAAGLRGVVTRKVGLDHVGNYGFTNRMPWGTQQHDEEARRFWESQEVAHA